MFKKIIAWALLITVTATVAVGGTLAYLTDRDSEANVFTTGDVDITLEEKFEQGSELLPGKDIEKDVQIKNEGPNDAWVWYTYAIPQALDTANDASANVLHVNHAGANWLGYQNNQAYWAEGQTEATPADKCWIVDYNPAGNGAPIGTKEVEGVIYNVYAVLYKGSLPVGETTTVGMTKVYFDKSVDIAPDGQLYKVVAGETQKIDWNINNDAKKTPVIFVNAYAIQKEGFDTVEAAYEAFAGQWGNMVDAGTYEIPEPGQPAPENFQAEYNGTTYDDIYAAVAAANANGGGTITLKGSAKLDKPVEIASDIIIVGENPLTTYTRADGYTDKMITVKANATLKTENLVLDGAGATATGYLVGAEANANIILNAGTVLKNNNGALAVNLGTRIGATLTLNGAEISNNSSDAGAIWGGGHITINEGSKIINNSSTGVAGAIRMVSNCNLTMNGGEISNNTAATNGGAIYGYGASTYNFNGGQMNGNTAAVGGAMYTGDGSTVNISGDFQMCGNTADDAGAMRLSNRTAFNMSGGEISGNTSKNSPEWDGFYGWNPGVNISGGELADDVTIQGGLTPTVGGDGITGVIHFALSTGHNTANLAKDFGTIKFTVAEGGNFAAFNFKPANGYTYTAGDEAKLVCMNEGYSTYWDAATSTFKIKAN